MNRYPGPRSFTGDDRHLFFGRDLEKQELFRLIVLNGLVVLFGESGTGKTSLLQAGVCPALEARQYKPVFIRLNNTAEAPEIQVCRQLKEGGFIPADMPEGRTLWEYFSRFWYVDLGEVFTPIFVFDQFEELFTLYKPDERKEFIKQFADITNHRPPPGLPPEAAAPPQAKFIFSIRSDFLYLLDELSADIPSILRCRFQLRLLGREQAADAITRPAGVEGAYVSPKFSYSPAALNGILEALGRHETEGRLAAGHPTATLEIAAFQLQLVCRQLEARIIQEQKPESFTIEPDFYGGRAGIRNIIDEFYNTVIEKVPAAEREAAERLLARGLIRNGRRIMMEESAMREEYGLSQATLAQLHEERLLKREARKGELYYEISHDTLVKPVLERFKKIEEAERERKAREEEERLQKEREKIRRARLRNIIIGIAALALLGFAFWRNNAALSAQQSAQQAEERATIQRQKAEEAEAKAKEAGEEAKQQQRIAELEKKKARTAREDAELAELKAKGEQAKAAQAEKELAEKSRILFKKFLIEANDDIYRLQYENALAKLYEAESFGLEKPAVARTYMEIAFWFAETNRLDSAKTATAAAARLLGREGLAKEVEKTFNRIGLRTLLKRLDNDHFDFLEARHFPDLVPIPESEFMMGSPDSIGSSNEHPQHPVRLSAFELGKTEVTYWQFAIYAENKGLSITTFAPDWGVSGDHPVVNVTWYDAARYANWLSIREGLDTAYIFEGDNFQRIDSLANGYRLPTEAQWEYAAGNGAEHTAYSWGNELPIGKKGGNVADETAKRKFPDWTIFTGYEDGFIYTAPVGSFNPNDFGLFDMTGNVWEWCQDRYGSYQEEAQVNPIGPDSGSYRVLRGGSWFSLPGRARCALRSAVFPDFRYYRYGFRLARTGGQ
ncbi:MAG: SUMF1/EgtB/PvdO family nonheme iron enzyme [Lewinellaceae bacterium]|nr:SUMF1/EgtB/PvdO family nonheme iron enzyme [Lewinellaceae bacterium]